MKVTVIKTQETFDYEDTYALRLIEQGLAVPAGDVPPTPQPEPELDPRLYGTYIKELQNQAADLQSTADELMLEIDAVDARVSDDKAFAAMHQTISQAKERKLEQDEEALQSEIDEMAGA